MPQNNRITRLNALKKLFTKRRFIVFLYYLPALSVSALCFCCILFLQKTPKQGTGNTIPQFLPYNTKKQTAPAAVMYTPFFKLPYYMPVNSTTHRLVIYASDIRLLTGCSKRSSQRQLNAVKLQLQKLTHQFVTIEEYCSYSGLNYEKTLVQIKLK